MKNNSNLHPPSPQRTTAEVEHRVMDWCRWQASQVHGDERLARVLQQGLAYASTREGEQLPKKAVLLMPDDTFCWINARGLDGGSNLLTGFVRYLAVCTVAWDCPAAAILYETWLATRPLAPGQRPSQQAERAEAVIIYAQGRTASPISVQVPIVGGYTVPIPQVWSEEQSKGLGFGRFVARCAPSDSEREAAKAVLARFGAGEGTARFEITPQHMAQLAAYNPDAKPQNR